MPLWPAPVSECLLLKKCLFWTPAIRSLYPRPEFWWGHCSAKRGNCTKWASEMYRKSEEYYENTLQESKMCEGKKVTESLRQKKISKIIESNCEDVFDWGNTGSGNKYEFPGVSSPGAAHPGSRGGRTRLSQGKAAGRTPQIISAAPAPERRITELEVLGSTEFVRVIPEYWKGCIST